MRRWSWLSHGFAGLLAILPAAAGAQGAGKAPIRGLVTMGKLTFIANPSILPDNTLREANTHPGLYSGAVILATWAQLEPARGRFDFGAIDQGLASIRAYNARNGATPLVGKLRVFGGPNAPDWAKRLDGGPVTLTGRDLSADVGHFWSEPYRAAWRELQAALAARYDSNTLLAEVAISSCASSTAEPFVIPLGAANLPALRDAGYNDEAMQACLMGAIDDYAPWRQTVLDYTFNPWRSLGPRGPRPDVGFTLKVMDAFRARYGSRGVLANHGLTPQINPPAQPLIDKMHRLGGPIEFQTRAPNQDWDATVQTGEQVGMTELEIWDTREAGGAAPVNAGQLGHWRSELRH